MKTNTKKIISGMVCLLLILGAVGCTKTTSNARATEWGYFYFPNTDWGMTEEEIFSALKKKKSDFEFGELPNGTLCYLTELSPLGEKAKTRFDFTATLTSDTPRLSNVQFIYDSGLTKEKGDEIKQKLEKLFKEQNVAVADVWEENKSDENDEASVTLYTLKSQKKMTDLPQDIKDAYNNKISAMYESGEYAFPDLGDIVDKDFIKAQNSAMSTATVAVLNDESGYVSINGSIILQIAEYSKK